jgi:hypothetical protein
MGIPASPAHVHRTPGMLQAGGLHDPQGPEQSEVPWKRPVRSSRDAVALRTELDSWIPLWWDTLHPVGQPQPPVPQLCKNALYLKSEDLLLGLLHISGFRSISFLHPILLWLELRLVLSPNNTSAARKSYMWNDQNLEAYKGAEALFTWCDMNFGLLASPDLEEGRKGREVRFNT